MSDVCEEQKRMIVDMRNEMDKIEVKIQDKETGAKEWVLLIIVIHWARM